MPQFKSIDSLALSFLHSPTLTSIHDHWKNHSLVLHNKIAKPTVCGLKLNIQKTKIMASGPITSWEIVGETVSDFIFWAPKSLQMVTAAMKLKDAYSLEEKL